MDPDANPDRNPARNTAMNPDVPDAAGHDAAVARHWVAVSNAAVRLVLGVLALRLASRALTPSGASRAADRTRAQRLAALRTLLAEARRPRR
ncbi:hypothetical protein [Streptomyces sp. B6B3]|uniref:hypothetical protein n=1 Tax=Streptomyces sp. B6B3 TaxID=3153570 RepID=UPI00325C8DE1